MSFLYTCLGIILSISSTLNLDESVFKLNKFFKLFGDEHIQVFYSNLITMNLVDYGVFKFHYLNGYFLKLIIFHSNLPVFFYFGILFILTTIFSLFLLSYYGFYGVFILNLVTIVLF
jgi:hypothetical protein